MAARIFKTCGVYQIKCLENGMIYIGSSKHITQRWNSHKYALNRGIHTNPFLQADWKEYGEEKFEFSILEETLEEKQYEREQFYLDKMRPFYRFGTGYNLAEIASPRETSDIRFYNKTFDNTLTPTHIKENGCPVYMPVTFEDYKTKTKDELQHDYDGYLTELYLEQDLILCNPDYI